jgi:iron complex transport system substrate-binding protein
LRALPIVVLLAACSSEPAGEPRGVVSLLPSATAWVVELGAGDRLVACTEFCRPGREVARVDWRGPGAAEAILRLNPALVIKQEPRAAEDPLRRILEKAGVEVLAIPSETIADVRAAIGTIGDALGLGQESIGLLQDFDRELRAARAGAKGEAPSVLMVYQRDPGPVANIAAAGPGSFLDELIRYSGGRNVLSDLEQAYVDLRLEEVVRRAPDMIIEVSVDNKPVAAADWDALASVPAVRDGRVHVVDASLIVVPGPGLPAAVRRLVELLHGGA